jgi:hypothetical protein
MTAITAPINVPRLRRELTRELLRAGVLAGFPARRRRLWEGILKMAGFSNAVENKVLDHLTGKAAYTSPAPLYMGLVTVAVAETDTSASVTEATYTGYARLQVPAADWGSAASGAVATAVQKAFAACTAGTSTVIGWLLSPISGTAGAGDVVMFGTCPSVTISTTQTPPTVASGALSMTLD